MGIQTVSQALSNENVAPFGFKNRIINGNFDIWQRGTSFSNPNDTYTADRFLVVPGGGTTGDTVSQQTFTPGQTDVPGEPTYFLRFAVGATSANRVMHHRVEDVRTFAGQTCTLSFYAKASTTHTSSVEFAQNFGSGGSSNVTLSSIAYTMSTSWQKFTFTVTLPSIAGKTIGTSSYLYIAFIRSLPASSVNIDIAQMQLEKGPQATAFDVRPFGTELALCQRYYETSYGIGYAIGSANSYPNNQGVQFQGFNTTSGQKHVYDWFKVPKRVVPTVTYYDYAGNSGKISSLDVGGTATNNVSIGYTPLNQNNLAVGATATWYGVAFFWTASAEL